MKDILLAAWSKISAAASWLWDKAVDIGSFGIDDIFDNLKTVTFFLFCIMATVLGTAAMVKAPRHSAASSCALTVEARGDYFCYEKARSPEGYLPMKQCKK